ncbi:MAG: aminotransferase class IV [Myxococcales bacterium]|nr:MAG: aminotransferase class IV [Myxococcales bacterium]
MNALKKNLPNSPKPKLIPEGLVSIDGQIMPADHAQVSALDRGFLYGDSVFEVLRTYDGAPHFLEQHLERLFRSASRVHMNLPFNIQVLRTEVLALIQANREDGDVYLRVVITRGPGPLSLSLDTDFAYSRIILRAPVKVPDEAAYEKGISVALVSARRYGAATSIAGVKSSNYLGNLLAATEVKENGHHEAVFLSEEGMLLEGSSSNVFIIKNGVLRTPPLSTGILPGITRTMLIEAARDLGVPVSEQPLYPQDIYTADEAFITSSVREVFPVVAVDGLGIAQGKPGPFTRRLHARYRQKLRK